MECSSHGQSQKVKAATPLHKAMEYETTQGEMPPVRRRQRRRALIYDSQMVMATTPLHKAMEYETAPAEMPPERATPSTPVSVDL
ncbi:hypothetical protein E2542_SST27795 [Spatholobus suberectus]|nr:hypothetical protein E2542_SST27795 [Spatholobus suberectus]